MLTLKTGELLKHHVTHAASKYLLWQRLLGVRGAGTARPRVLFGGTSPRATARQHRHRRGLAWVCYRWHAGLASDLVFPELGCGSRCDFFN